MVETTLGGVTCRLMYNGTALFAVRDIVGDNLIDTLTLDTAQGYDDLCRIVAVLAEQGELVRRYEGYDKGPMLSADDVRLLTRPADIPDLKRAVLSAVMLGYGREINPDKEVDLGLRELQKKTEND